MAQRAGKVASGDFAVQKAVQGNKAKLILVAADAAVETQKKYQHLAAEAKIDLYYLYPIAFFTLFPNSLSAFVKLAITLS